MVYSSSYYNIVPGSNLTNFPFEFFEFINYELEKLERV